MFRSWNQNNVFHFCSWLRLPQDWNNNLLLIELDLTVWSRKLDSWRSSLLSSVENQPIITNYMNCKELAMFPHDWSELGSSGLISISVVGLIPTKKFGMIPTCIVGSLYCTMLYYTLSIILHPWHHIWGLSFKSKWLNESMNRWRYSFSKKVNIMIYEDSIQFDINFWILRI